MFEVHNEDGSPVGLFVLDLVHARLQARRRVDELARSRSPRCSGTRPIVVNNLNVPKPAPGEPTLLTYDEVTTLFHEFGHALHGLFARVTYPKFAGTNVFRDFVEFPSQVNEMWMLWPEVLGELRRAPSRPASRMPQELVDKLHASETFNEGFETSEYLAAALLDQAWHSLSARDAARHRRRGVRGRRAGGGRARQPGRADRATRATYFAHVFSGGYDAGLLLLHLERGARCRHRRVVQGERRAHAARTATGSAGCCSASADRRIRSRPTATSAAGMP